ncbi:MAG TPA: sigma 54-interacting transcriptional regulator [Kofleriaceae bacterium]|nr:sigma 54-interacting transcriptional regulator [Kofleriaceae bacterium]
MPSDPLVDPPEDLTAAPAIVMVASGTQAASLVLPATAELGRRIAATGVSREVADERMSRDHATVKWDRGLWIVRDLDSRNGTYVNGERITREIRRRGDLVLRLGHTVFVLLADGRGHTAEAGAASAGVVGPELARAYDQIRRCAAADTLLLLGEPGSGKDVAARLYHESGPRRAGPFVAVSCAAIPDGVADRLLFGGKKGIVDTIGQYQLAQGGTLFLDDLADLAGSAQRALVQLLDTGKAKADRVGIVAGGHELRAAISEGQLRDDLVRRIATTTVSLPPLRSRRVDIARLVQREIADHAERSGRALTPHAKLLETCCLRSWPGNISELRASIRAAAAHAVTAGRAVVRVEDLPEAAGLPLGSVSSETAVERPRHAAPLALDKATITAALERANGVVSVAARALGMHRSQLYKLLDQHGIAHDK